MADPSLSTNPEEYRRWWEAHHVGQVIDEMEVRRQFIAEVLDPIVHRLKLFGPTGLTDRQFKIYRERKDYFEWRLGKEER